MHEAMLYTSKGKTVQCNLCNRLCVIPNGKRGFCRVRENQNGKLYSLVYGKAAGYAVDKIEKKPFFHFWPDSSVFSFSTVGCNFRCLNCQNWDISQPSFIFGEDLTPEKILQLTKMYNCNGIAYTYTEPTIFFEYAYDTAKLAKKEKLFNVFVTNGYMTPETINQMGDIDASRIDLKSFNDKFYQEVCGGAHLEPVLKSIKLLHQKGPIEIINLLIPGKNDSNEEIKAISEWIYSLDKEIPLHFIAFYPANKMLDVPPTSIETLKRARNIALNEGLHYVYTGNMPGLNGEWTYCPNCGEISIKRFGFEVIEYNLDEKNKCKNCGHKIPIFGKYIKSKK